MIRKARLVPRRAMRGKRAEQCGGKHRAGACQNGHPTQEERHGLAPTAHFGNLSLGVIISKTANDPRMAGHAHQSLGRQFNLDIARSIWASLFNLSQEPIADHA